MTGPDWTWQALPGPTAADVWGVRWARRHAAGTGWGILDLRLGTSPQMVDWPGSAAAHVPADPAVVRAMPAAIPGWTAGAGPAVWGWTWWVPPRSRADPWWQGWMVGTPDPGLQRFVVLVWRSTSEDPGGHAALPSAALQTLWRRAGALWRAAGEPGHA